MSSHQFHPNQPVAPDLDWLLLEFSRRASQLGGRVRPFDAIRGTNGLSSLLRERVNSVAQNLTRCIEALEFAAGQVSKGTPTGHLFLWRALKNFGYAPPSDLFALLDETSRIEIYDNEGKWIFGNIGFYGVTSYTLAELYEFPWHMLWHRSELDQARVHALGVKLLGGQVKAPLANPFPTHVVKEQSLVRGVSSELGLEVEIAPLLVAPLYARGTQNVAGFLHSFHANWIRPTKVEANLPETNNTKVFKTPPPQIPTK